MSSKILPGAGEFWSKSGRLVSPFKKESASTHQIVLLGITIVIGGQLFSWNLGLQGGFYTFLVSTLFIASGYVCLCLCLAEMTSILPFAGGSYGFARVTVGPYLGYLIGCCESIESIIYVPSTLLVFGTLLSTLFATSTALEPIWWLLFYITALFLHIGGGKFFWHFNSLIGFVSLILIVLYCLATPAFLDYEKNVTDLNPFFEPKVANPSSPRQFLQYVHLAAWFFVGVEGLPLACLEAKNAKVSVPRAILITIGVLVITALAILFCTASLSPGVVALASAPLPLSAGYSRAFDITERAASLLALPGIYATAFGFMFLYGRQMSSMSKSGLFPSFLSQSFGPSQTPYMALIAGSAVGYCVLLIFYFTYRKLLESLFNICILGSFFVYIHSFASFIIFRRKFSRLHRNFTNSLGIASAVYGMFVFLVAFIGVAAFQNDNQDALLIFIGMLVLCSTYYYFVARKRQFFSPEEQSIMFVTYVIAGNAHKKLKKRRTHNNNMDDGGSLRISIRSQFSSVGSAGRKLTPTTTTAPSAAPPSIQNQLSFRLVSTSPAPELADEPEESNNNNNGTTVTASAVGLVVDFPSSNIASSSTSTAIPGVPASPSHSPHPEGMKRFTSSTLSTASGCSTTFAISNRSRVDDDLLVIDEEGEGEGFESGKL